MENAIEKQILEFYSFFLKKQKEITYENFSKKLDSILNQKKSEEESYNKNYIKMIIPLLICGKTINIGDLSFECFDCALDSDFHLICEECFRKSNHKGHRVRYTSNKKGSCDCGDIDIIYQNSFCENHKKKCFN